MLKIRLRRMGARNRAFYRVVVSDSRRATTSAAVEELGFYDPLQEPPRVEIDAARVGFWVNQGAQVSPTVKKLLARVTPAA